MKLALCLLFAVFFLTATAQSPEQSLKSKLDTERSEDWNSQRQLDSIFAYTYDYFRHKYNSIGWSEGLLKPIGYFSQKKSDYNQQIDESYQLIQEALAGIKVGELSDLGLRMYTSLKGYLHYQRLNLQLPSEKLLQFQDDLGTINYYFSAIPHSTVEEQDYALQELKQADDFLRMSMEDLKAGLDEGYVSPCVVVKRKLEAAQALAELPIEDLPFYETFTMQAPGRSAAEHEAYLSEVQEVLENELKPAFAAFAQLMADYQGKCRTGIGISEVPDGNNYYQAKVAYYTTTDLSIEEIHKVGLKEVARIRAEMDSTRLVAGFEGSHQDFVAFLKKDAQFQPQSEEEVLNLYRAVCKKIDPELGYFFYTLPRNTYGIKAVPEALEATRAFAYYNRGSLRSGKPGYFYANMIRPQEHYTWNAMALSLHEAVPGHHFQVSIAQELEGVPPLFRHLSSTAYVEGWGLYSEYLGIEMGLYDSPYEYMGRLSMEMMRAVRLVVDTGMHAKGWTRQQAIDYFLDNSLLGETNAISEIDRYISLPGQALAYKIGELKIKELRAMAEAELGEDFDLRAFHDLLLAYGAMPLSALQASVESWVAEQKAY